jgi:hypothetical protein
MFEKIGRAAENMATRVSMSRRGFLGRLGQAALIAAGVVGALAISPEKARAQGPRAKCCYYASGAFLCTHSPCPKTYSGSPLVSQNPCSLC